MTCLISYKNINYLIRILIGIGAFLFIAFKLYTYFTGKSFELLKTSEIQFYLLFIALVLVFFNWGIEAIKWKYLIKRQIHISFFKALKLVITGITIGLITPNRIGEIPARVFLLPTIKNKNTVLTATFIGAFSQLLITLIAGIFAVYFNRNELINYFSTQLQFLFFSCLIGLLYCYFFPLHIINLIKKIPLFSSNKYFNTGVHFFINEKFIMLILSGLRYVVFFVQYYLVLEAVGIHFDSLLETTLIAVCFLLSSVVPTLIFSEIAVRGSVALLIFSFISSNEFAIFSASLILWLINVTLPASIGIFGLTKFQLPQKK